MKQQKVLAERYAQALFSLGKEAKQEGLLEEVEQQLQRFFAACQENKDLHNVFTFPLYPPEQRQAVLRDLSKQLGWNDHTQNFLLLLVEKGRAALLPEILEAFSSLTDQHKERIHVQVQTPSLLSQEYLQSLKTQLQQQTGKEIVLHVEETPELLAGMIVKIGDKMLDSSLASRLDDMKEQLLQQIRQS